MSSLARLKLIFMFYALVWQCIRSIRCSLEYTVFAYHYILPRYYEPYVIHVYTCTGFCGESEQEHADTVSLMGEVAFDQAFMFAYSLREKTHAAHTMVS